MCPKFIVVYSGTESPNIKPFQNTLLNIKWNSFYINSINGMLL